MLTSNLEILVIYSPWKANQLHWIVPLLERLKAYRIRNYLPITVWFHLHVYESTSLSKYSHIVAVSRNLADKVFIHQYIAFAESWQSGVHLQGGINDINNKLIYMSHSQPYSITIRSPYEAIKAQNINPEPHHLIASPFFGPLSHPSSNYTITSHFLPLTWNNIVSRLHVPVIALGGITPKSLHLVADYRLNGVALRGYLWKGVTTWIEAWERLKLFIVLLLKEKENMFDLKQPAHAN